MGRLWKFSGVDYHKLLVEDNIKSVQHNQSVQALLEVLLRVPKIRECSFSSGAIAASKAANLASPLVAIPQELIDIITLQIAGPHLIALTMTCSYFFKHLAPRLQEAVLAYELSFTNDRVIALGTIAETSCECGRPAKRLHCHWAIVSEGDNDLEISETVDPEIRRLYSFIPRHLMISDFLLSYSGSWYDKVRSTVATPDDDAMFLKRFLHLDPLVSEETIIRNLDKRQYIRKSKISNLPNIYPLGPLVCAILMWDKRAWDKERHYGGHHIDVNSITTIDESWMDVSERMLGFERQESVLRMMHRRDWQGVEDRNREEVNRLIDEVTGRS